MAEPWATPEELRLHLRLATIDDTQAAAIIAEAETTVRAELQQDIDAVVADVADLVGNGRIVLLLPQMPVTAVTAVTADGVLLTEDVDYRWNRYGILTRLTLAGQEPRCWALDADVTVTYDHGYATVPKAVKQVALQIAGRAWANPGGGAVASESLGDRSVSYDNTRTGQHLTGHEARMLAPYGRGNESR